MSENVVNLGAASIRSERREAFLLAVAQSFERYVADYGFEPDAIVYTLAGVKQPSRTGWDIQGGSIGGGSAILALAATHMLAEAQAGTRGR